MTPAGQGSPDLGQILLFLAVAAALPFAAWFVFERFAAFMARLITLATGRRDPVVARPRGGGDGMLGEVGVVRRPLAPRGKVFVRGELWDAVAAPGVAGEGAADDLPAGLRVRVQGLDGLTLRVAPLPADEAGDEAGHENRPGAAPVKAPSR